MNPRLAVWSHLTLDAGLAERLAAMSTNATPARCTKCGASWPAVELVDAVIIARRKGRASLKLNYSGDTL